RVEGGGGLAVAEDLAHVDADAREDAREDAGLERLALDARQAGQQRGRGDEVAAKPGGVGAALLDDVQLVANLERQVGGRGGREGRGMAPVVEGGLSRGVWARGHHERRGTGGCSRGRRRRRRRWTGRRGAGAASGCSGARCGCGCGAEGAPDAGGRGRGASWRARWRASWAGAGVRGLAARWAWAWARAGRRRAQWQRVNGLEQGESARGQQAGAEILVRRPGLGAPSLPVDTALGCSRVPAVPPPPPRGTGRRVSTPAPPGRQALQRCLALALALTFTSPTRTLTLTTAAPLVKRSRIPLGPCHRAGPCLLISCEQPRLAAAAAQHPDNHTAHPTHLISSHLSSAPHPCLSSLVAHLPPALTASWLVSESCASKPRG
ncbi:hypothetical protein SVAN01_11927, partial [Stagonosporopsis vannaccii]